MLKLFWILQDWNRYSPLCFLCDLGNGELLFVPELSFKHPSTSYLWFLTFKKQWYPPTLVDNACFWSYLMYSVIPLLKTHCPQDKFRQKICKFLYELGPVYISSLISHHSSSHNVHFNHTKFLEVPWLQHILFYSILSFAFLLGISFSLKFVPSVDLDFTSEVFGGEN